MKVEKLFSIDPQFKERMVTTFFLMKYERIEAQKLWEKGILTITDNKIICPQGLAELVG